MTDLNFKHSFLTVAYMIQVTNCIGYINNGRTYIKRGKL